MKKPMCSKKKILFVDDEPKVLAGIHRSLHSMREQWDMRFADSGEEALKILKKEHFNVIISDMSMPGIGGKRLLEYIRNKHPQTIRIAISGDTSKDVLLRSIGPVHQFLPKPCDIGILKYTIKRTCAIQDSLVDKKLREVLSELDVLPSLPSSCTDLIQELEDEQVSLHKITEIVRQDMAMSVKILQFVNSAYFGLPHPVYEISRAITLLGFDTLKTFVIAAKIFTYFDQIELEGFSLNRTWDHCLNVGEWAKLIAQQENFDKTTLGNCIIAGMMHDLGKVVLARKLPNEYGRIITLSSRQRIPIFLAEREILGTTHAEVGGYLLGLWGFSSAIVETVALHHFPADGTKQEFTELTAVIMANKFSHEFNLPYNHTDEYEYLDLEYLNKLGLAEKVPLWHEVCQSRTEVRD
ncbi:MAG: HDOD domain-containing protein [Sedimentisphaerales bacterium]|nr:HDOD domain-containing protein [Sedimentisphaerales bacterium]